MDLCLPSTSLRAGRRDDVLDSGIKKSPIGLLKSF